MIRSIKHFNQIIIWLSVLGLVFGMSNIWPLQFNAVRQAFAAQVTINGDYFASFAEQNASPQVAFTTDSIGYAFYVDETTDSPRYKKTTDGGATWGGEVALGTDLNWGSVSIWYDQWTPGDSTGTKIYMAGCESSTDDVWFKTLDTNGDTLSPTSTTWTRVAAGTAWANTTGTGAAVTKNSDGNLFASCSSTGALDVYKSVNGGANWSATTSGLDVTTDFNQLIPIGNSGDVLLLNHDTSANQFRSNVYDEATDAWSGFTNRIAATENATYDGSFGAAINKSTGEVYVAINNNPAVSGGDIVTARVVSDGTTNVTWNNTTDVYTNIGTAGLQATMAVDWHNGDVYCFYLRGTVGSAMSIYYKKSTDQGANWSSETGPVSSSTGNYQQVYANMTSPYKIHVSWADTTNLDMLAVNYTDTSALDIADVRMMLFYDGSSVPTGWSSLSASAGDIFYQKYPRGGAYYGVYGGSNADHTHVGTVSNEQEALVPPSTPSSGSALVTFGHTHGFLASVGNANIQPPYREIQLIQYDAGIPTGASAIPSGAIALFDDTVPTGWTRYSAQDSSYTRTGPYAASPPTGGSATHNHALSFVALGGTGGNGTGGGIKTDSAAAVHTHTVSSPTNTQDTANDPIRTNFIIGKIDSTGADPGNMIAMFTGDPGAGWTSKSGTSEAYEGRFIYGASSYTAAAGTGSSTHTHASDIGVTSGLPSATGNSDNGRVVNSSSNLHYHTFDVSYDNQNDLPAYVDVGMYKSDPPPAYTPASRQWRWYDAENVADPSNTLGGETTTGDAISNEDTAPSSANIAYSYNAIKLRIVIGETNGAGGTNVKYKLQYDTSALFLSPIDLDAQGGSVVAWRYYDGGNVVDDAAISTGRLSGSPSLGRHNEDADTGVGAGSSFDPGASTDYEHEFTIQASKSLAKVAYYFRVQYMENSDAAGGSWTTVPLGASASYPNLRTADTFSLEMSQLPSTVSFGTYNKGGAGNQAYVFQPGEEIVFWDKRGTLLAYDLTVDPMDMNGGGDTIPGSDITWTSTTGSLNGSFASDPTGFTGQAGATLDAPRTVYSAGAGVDQTMRGGFYFLPTVSLANLESRTDANYTGTLTLTIV